MALNRTNGASLLRPEDVADLVVRPLAAESVAMQTGTLRQTNSSTYRIPIVTADPNAVWVDEANPIPLTDATFGSVIVAPSKIAAISVVSREEVDDSEIAPVNAIGDGLVRDLARKVDAAWFLAQPAPSQAGLQALAAANGSQVQTVSAGANFANVDFAAEAAALIEVAGGQVSAFVTGPTTALALARLKTAAGSNVPLLAPSSDPARSARRQLEGKPLFVSAAVPAGTVWAYDGSTTFVVMRQGVNVDIDRSVRFTSDEIAIRLTARIGFGFAAPARIVKITTT